MGPSSPPSGATDEGDEAALEAARKLFAQECRFVAGAPNREAMPDAGLPEIAFAGRSNVGKSSLINALTGRKSLARTSQTPGRTQQVNFFDLAGRLGLVDLPGYGYARASKSRIKEWTAVVNDYLKGRATLRRALVLVDARHGLKESDRAVMRMLDEAAVSYQIVLTKIDRTSGEERGSLVADLAGELTRHAAAHPEIAATSAETGAGIPELRAVLARLAAP
jgi:GTP-binding protein